MSDKATMLRETVEAFTDLRAVFDGLTEEQASRVWLGVLGVRDIVKSARKSWQRTAASSTSFRVPPNIN